MYIYFYSKTSQDCCFNTHVVPLQTSLMVYFFEDLKPIFTVTVYFIYRLKTYI